METTIYYLKKIFLISIILCFPFVANAQTKAEKINDLLNRYYEYHLFNGTALVADSGKVIFKKGYGYANIEWKVPNVPDAKFRIGSISKQFTATIIMQLVQEGKISLSRTISDYLPNYRKDTGSKVTIKDLLTHTSGIKSYTSMPHVWRDSLRNHYTEKYLIKKFQSGNLEFKPGTRFLYDNTGYYLLAAIAEKVTKEKFSKLLRERILDPLGMKNTGSDNSKSVINKMASGYLRTFKKYYRDPYIYMPNVMGAGQMYSTVEDLYKWDQALYSDKILNASSKKKMFTPYKEKYGFGWFIFNQPVGNQGDSVKTIMHTGGINGFNTIISRLINRKGLIVLLNNTGVAPLLEMEKQIANILYNYNYKYPKQPISYYLYNAIKNEGIDKAISDYKKLKAEEFDLFDFSVNQLNNLGYYFLSENKTGEAIKIFKLNISAYPKSANVYDSMGEAYMKNNQKQLAIKYYKKSLLLNPGNTNAIKKLKKLGINYKSPVTVSPGILKTYTGKYELLPNFSITIRLKNNHLFAQATGQGEFEIFPESKTKFYYKIVDAQIEFIKDKTGKVNKLILYQNGRVLPAKKVK